MINRCIEGDKPPPLYSLNISSLPALKGGKYNAEENQTDSHIQAFFLF